MAGRDVRRGRQGARAFRAVVGVVAIAAIANAFASRSFGTTSATLQEPGAAQVQAPTFDARLGDIESKLRPINGPAYEQARADLERLLAELRPRVLDAPSPVYLELETFVYACIDLAGLPDARREREDVIADARKASERSPLAATRQDLQAQVELEWSKILSGGNERLEALDVARRALDDYPDARIARPYLLNQAAELERLGKNTAEALRLLDECGESLLDHADPPVVPHQGPRCTMAFIRAQTYMDLGLPDMCAVEIAKGRPLAEALGDDDSLAGLLLLQASLQLATHRQALVIAELGKRLADPTFLAGRPEYRARLTARLGMAQSNAAAEAGSEDSAARATLEQALAFEGLGDAERCSAELRLVHSWLLRERKPAEAKAHLDLAGECLARLEAHTGPSAMLGDRALYEAYRMRLTLVEPADEALERAQFERLVGAVEALLRQMEDVPIRAGGVGFLHYDFRRFMLSEWMRAVIQLDGKDAGFEPALAALQRAQAIGSLARALDARPRSLAELRSALASPDHGIVVYMPGVDCTHLFAFDATTTTVCEVLKSKDELRSLIQGLNRLVSRSPRESSATEVASQRAELERVRMKLAEELFPAALRSRMSSWKHITVVGADLLDNVAFECLAWNGDGWLGQELAIDYLPSLVVGAKLVQRSANREPPNSSIELWLVAAPASARGGPIPFDADDERALVAPYRSKGSERARVFTGKAAGPACLRDRELGGARVLHVIAHGVDDTSRERPAGLALASSGKTDDGILWCGDVEKLSVPRVVVLSACGAARGQLRYGEDGLTNLGGAFLLAGADCVVLSRFDLEVEATQALMEVFHQRLRLGDSPAEAMRAARKSVASQGRFSHPFYHSLLQVIGLGRRPIF